MLTMFGRHDAVGLSWMGVERAPAPDPEMVRGFDLIAQLAPLMRNTRATAPMSAVLLAAGDPPKKIQVGNYTMEVARMRPRVARFAPPGFAAAIFIATGPDEFYAAGTDRQRHFCPKPRARARRNRHGWKKAPSSTAVGSQPPRIAAMKPGKARISPCGVIP